MTAPNVSDSTAAEAPATEQSAAPETAAAPEFTGRESIGSMVEHAADEHFAEGALGRLAGKSDITLADLRTLPGAEGLSDQQLQQMWQQTAKPQTPPATQQTAATEAAKRAWKLYQGDTEVTDYSKMTLADLFDGKVQIGYTANKAEQRRAFDALIRNAQQGHYNAERTTQLTTERNTALEQARQLQAQYSEMQQQRQMWEGALNNAMRGDYTQLQAILDAYTQALQQSPQQQQPAPGAVPPGYVPAAQVEAERVGRQVYETTVLPRANELATQYGLPANEVAQAIMYMVQQEPAEFLTRERFQQLVDVELPMHIENMLASRQPAAADPRDTQIAQLQQELTQLRGTAAQQHNSRVQQLHQTRRNAPSPSSTLPAGAGPLESPDFDGAHGAREWLRNLK